MTRLGTFISVSLLVMGAAGFFVSSLLHNRGAGCYCAAVVILGLISSVLPWGAEEDSHEPLNDATDRELAEEWLAKRDERHEIAEQRVLLGVAHARLNRETMLLEVELIARCPGEVFEFEDGRTLFVGFPQSPLSGRMRLRKL